MRSHHRILRNLFQTLAGGAAVAACGGGVSTSGFNGTVCDGDQYQPLTNLTPATPVDYIEIRAENEGVTSSEFFVRAKIGVPCATATNPAACQTNLAAVRSLEGFPSGSGGGDMMPSRSYIVYTHGDAIATLTRKETVAAFFGVDAIKDAALLAHLQNQSFVCPSQNAHVTPQGEIELITQTGFACGEGTGIDQHRLIVKQDGSLVIEETARIKNGESGCAIGRRPEGLGACDARARNVLADHFTTATWLEAASVPAFRRLGKELRAHGAPATLVRRSHRSARDEIKHTRMTASLARRFGGAPRKPRVKKLPNRSLFEVARENMIEGCVRETFGALVATISAKRAGDRRVGLAMQTIAKDETRHAALAWDIAAWAQSRLTEDEKRELEAARQGAIDALRNEMSEPQNDALVRVVGLPTANEALRLVDEMFRALSA